MQGSLTRIAWHLVSLLILFQVGCQQQSAPPATGKTTETTTMSSAQDLAQVLQQVLDAKELQQYYHEDELSDRKPVRIAKGTVVADQPGLVKFGVPVVYQSRDELVKQDLPFVEFKRVTIANNRAEVAFTYDVEGLICNAVLVRGDQDWRVDTFTISEE